MKHDIFKFFEDIRLSIDLIEQHVESVASLQEYSKDQKTIDSVERRLAIIGEALYQAGKKAPELKITGKAKIIGLRHILVHEYDLINDATIWKIVHENLPLLKAEVIALLNEPNNG